MLSQGNMEICPHNFLNMSRQTNRQSVVYVWSRLFTRRGSFIGDHLTANRLQCGNHSRLFGTVYPYNTHTRTHTHTHTHAHTHTHTHTQSREWALSHLCPLIGWSVSFEGCDWLSVESVTPAATRCDLGRWLKSHAAFLKRQTAAACWSVAFWEGNASWRLCSLFSNQHFCTKVSKQLNINFHILKQGSTCPTTASTLLICVCVYEQTACLLLAQVSLAVI